MICMPCSKAWRLDGTYGGADEQKPAKRTVERGDVLQKPRFGGWYGLKKGLRGRFGVYTYAINGKL